MLKQCMHLVRGGGSINFEQAVALARDTQPEHLFEAADRLRREFHKDNIDLCSIVNAKSGKCSENCKFCAQSSWHDVAIESYDSVSDELALSMARENEEYGVKRFSLVTAGRSLTDGQLAGFGNLFSRIAEATNHSLCASMGFLTQAKAEKLISFGVSRYHCNLEACRSYFPEVCSTHTYDEKVETITIAQQAGMEVCSGGIIGMGETFEQRLELAFELRELGILSIPINILNPIPNTPLADVAPLEIPEILTCLAMFRFINPKAVIRLAGGRVLMGNSQRESFLAGANGAIVGNYLTTAGNSLAEDIAMFTSLGFNVELPENREQERRL
ncbi:biotin synthase BioB [Desulfosediminicola ganghwensis]|uniref:biotin synthase BioB n=1 Tax=Desulfosediminicola ganghwensis TaxID=2569540 RepID=UPI0010ACFA7F|nr:biotin synthase BioB [Desulfosediminicola ganghwensis]